MSLSISTGTPLSATQMSSLTAAPTSSGATAPPAEPKDSFLSKAGETIGYGIFGAIPVVQLGYSVGCIASAAFAGATCGNQRADRTALIAFLGSVANVAGTASLFFCPPVGCGLLAASGALTAVAHNV